MGSAVEQRVAGMLEEWRQIVVKECAVALRLDRIDNAVHQKFPDLVYDILKIDGRSSLERCETRPDDRSLLVEQWQVKIELDKVKELRRKKEANLQREADTYRDSVIEGIPAKRARC